MRSAPIAAWQPHAQLGRGAEAEWHLRGSESRVFSRPAEKARNDCGRGRDNARQQDGVRVREAQSGAVGGELADVNLRTDASAQDAEAPEIADEEGAGREGEFGAWPAGAGQQWGEADHHQSAGNGGGAERGEVAAGAVPCGLCLGDAGPEGEGAGQGTQRRAAANTAGQERQVSHHCRHAVCGDEPQALDASIGPGIDPVEPSGRAGSCRHSG